MIYYILKININWLSSGKKIVKATLRLQFLNTFFYWRKKI